MAVKVIRETGGSYYRVDADTEQEMAPLRPMLEECRAEWYTVDCCRVFRLYRQRVEEAVAALQTRTAAPTVRQATAQTRTCVQCGDPIHPTAPAYATLCIDCYQAERPARSGSRRLGSMSRYHGDY